MNLFALFFARRLARLALSLLAVGAGWLSVPRAIADTEPVSAPVAEWSTRMDITPDFPDQFVTFGSHVFFTARDPLYGRELWKSDGTREGTVMVADLTPGRHGGRFDWFVVAGDKMFFSINTESLNNTVLWVTDGSAKGTIPLKSARLGAFAGADPDYAVMGGILYFSANEGHFNKAELWRSDGTVSGTYRVLAGPEAPNQFTVLGDNIYFSAGDGWNPQKLWRSDGTPEGTMVVAELAPLGLLEWKGALYFGHLGSTAAEAGLWSSDGTAGGTLLIKKIEGYDFRTNPYVILTPAGGYLYFIAPPEHDASGLWRSDGTEAGTVLLKNLRASPETFASPRRVVLHVAGGIVYFSAVDAEEAGAENYEL